ncbi:MAG TPA: HAD-IIIC family phosphatase, partial [Myxococcales bacterium]|nr:HAD-IIIC family phosphatase [Myxococcales bacterium]
MNDWTIAVAATFTADPVAETLRFWTAELDLEARVELAPYDQVLQQLLDDHALLGGNRHGVNVILFRPEDLLRRAGEGADPAELLKRGARDLCSAVEVASARAATAHLVVVCPMSPASEADEVRKAALTRFEQWLQEGLAGVPGASVALPAEMFAWYPVQRAHSEGGDEAGHLPYSEEGAAALATQVARKIHALLSAPPKVIAVDADQTLWAGVVGEDGPQGVKVDPPHRALQQALRRQMDAGALLCLCSKNEEADVLAVLKDHPDMLLRQEDFLARRVNWRAKSQNLRSLADDLRMSLETFLFLDDSPLECSEVESRCPEVRAIQLPKDPQAIPHYLEHVWALDRLRVTAEDRQRTEVYRQNLVRERLRRESMTLRDFLKGLGLQIEITPAQPHQLRRLAQLSERTTQLNLTALRLSEGELRMELARPGVECLVVSAKDRFGDYGLVGTMLVEPMQGRLMVRMFLLSCRALGRGIEHRMLAALGERARDRGLPLVEIPFTSTRRNAPAGEFLRSRL